MFYAVRAYDEAGNASAFSAVVSETIPVTALIAPTGVTSTNQVNGVLIEWQPEPTATDGFEIDYSEDGPDGTWAALLVAPTLSPSWLDGEIPDLTRRWYRVKSKAGVSTSAPSALTAGHSLSDASDTFGYPATWSAYWLETPSLSNVSAEGNNELKFGKSGNSPRNAAIWIPQIDLDGAAVATGARLRFKAKSDTLVAGANLRVTALDGVTAAPPNPALTALQRYDYLQNPTVPRGAVSVDWSPGTWASATEQFSNAIHTVINERLSDPDWFSGAGIMLYLEDLASSPDAQRNAHAAGVANPDNLPYLEVSFTISGNAIGPGQPTDIAGSAEDTGNRITLTANVDNDFAGYFFERSLTAGGPRTRLNANPQAVDTFLDQAVVDDVQYFYTALPVDEGDIEGVRSTEVSVLTNLADAPPPPPPPPATTDWETNFPCKLFATQFSIDFVYETPLKTAAARMGPSPTTFHPDIDVWFLRTSGVSGGATTIPLTRGTPILFLDNTEITWFDPVAKNIIKTRLAADVPAGSMSLPIDAAPEAIAATAWAWTTGIQYRPAADASVWYMGLKGERFDDVSPMVSGFAGTVAVNLTPNTDYLVRLTIRDAGGSYVENPREVAVSTVPEVTTLTHASVKATATHYINRTTGSDANNGTSSGTAWQTMGHAEAEFDAAASPKNWRVLLLGKDHYTNTRHGIGVHAGDGDSFAWIGDVAAITGETEPTLALGTLATRTRVSSGYMTGPGGSGATLSNAVGQPGRWTLITGNGPINSRYALNDWYKITIPDDFDAEPFDVQRIAISFAFDGALYDLWHASTIHPSYRASAEHVADFLQHIDTTNYGWAKQGNEIIMRLPPTLDGVALPTTNPNGSIWIWFGGATLVNFTTAGEMPNAQNWKVRESGIEFGPALYPIEHTLCNFAYTDHCDISAGRFGIARTAQWGSTWAFGKHDVVRQCVFDRQTVRGTPGAIPAVNEVLSIGGIKGYSYLWGFVQITEVQQGGNGTSSIQRLDYVRDSPNDEWWVEFPKGGDRTANLSRTITAAALQTAINALPSIQAWVPAATQVTVTGGPLPGTPFTITFPARSKPTFLTNLDPKLLTVPGANERNVFGNFETACIKGDGGSWGLVAQHNRFRDWFNGSLGARQGSNFKFHTPGRFAGAFLYATDNDFYGIADDPFECEENATCMKYGRNTVRYTTTFLTSASANYATSIMWLNTIINASGRETGFPQGLFEDSGLLNKMSPAEPKSHMSWFHCTYMTNVPKTKGWHKTNNAPGVIGAHLVIGCIVGPEWRIGQVGLREDAGWADLFNVLVCREDEIDGSRVSGFGFEPFLPDEIDIGKQTPTRLYRTAADVALYRAESNTGDWSQRFGVGGAVAAFTDKDRLETLFVDIATDDLRLDADADGAGVNPLVGVVMWIPGNISDSEFGVGVVGNVGSKGAV